MVGFLVEFGRFALVVLTQLRRWVFRKRRNFFISIVTVAGLAIAFSIAIHAGDDANAPAPNATPTPTPTDTIPYTEVQATPIAGEAPSVTPTPTRSAPSASAEPQGAAGGSFTKPREPKVDRQDPASVASAWGVAYLSRPGGSWDGWKAWVAPYVTDAMVDRLSKPLEGMADEQLISAGDPMRVTGVTFSAPDSSMPKNTPIRWSRIVNVKVETEKRATETLAYSVVESKTDDGWTISSVTQRGKASD
jgi:hypothetical protein